MLTNTLESIQPKYFKKANFYLQYLSNQQFGVGPFEDSLDEEIEEITCEPNGILKIKKNTFLVSGTIFDNTLKKPTYIHSILDVSTIN